jgi:hypothetical protein
MSGLNSEDMESVLPPRHNGVWLHLSHSHIAGNAFVLVPRPVLRCSTDAHFSSIHVQLKG